MSFPALSYIHVMRKRKAQRGYTWEMRRLTGTPAAFIGLVDAPDEKSALATRSKTRI